ncbi:hypothetical protein PCANC_11962 [Puccinia coronata f. sp. avenae]|uniref:Uncharacterized protein n=1 Tax=Puccinia coronata f. sp. avenae TaxID=200324 RepID=A0A2N5T371_9BASI|nr:hypothetical protein PCANC_11962 [Puccinia coronata f. sp. avenae]
MLRILSRLRRVVSFRQPHFLNLAGHSAHRSTLAGPAYPQDLCSTPNQLRQIAYHTSTRHHEEPQVELTAAKGSDVSGLVMLHGTGLEPADDCNDCRHGQAPHGWCKECLTAKIAAIKSSS